MTSHVSENTPIPVLIGRDAELDLLYGMIEATVAGEGGCAAITAVPGMGKTSLLNAATARARDLGLATAAGRATPHDRRAPLVTLRNALQPIIGPLPGASGLTEGKQGFWYVDQIRVALETYVAAQPLLVIVDDAQWADELSTVGLRALISELTSSPVRWLLARRPGAPGSPVHQAIEWLVGSGAATAIDLAPLSEPAVAQICTRTLGARPDQTVLALASRTEGNPFLLEQLLDTLRRSDQIVISSSGVATAVGDELASTFFQVVNQRLSALSAPTLRLLQAGAVLGRPFSIAAAAGVLALPPAHLLSPADEAVHAGILVGDGANLLFRHDLLREAIYNSIAEHNQAALHLAAADVLRRERRSPLEIAEHLLRSGPTNDEPAVEELLAAAEQAKGRAPEAAADLVTRALELLGPHDSQRVRVSAEAVRLLAEAGRLERAREVGEDVLRSGLDGAVEADVLLGLAEAAKHAGRNPIAAEYATRGLALERARATTRANLHAVHAHTQIYGGDLALADQAGAAAHEIGEAAGEHSAAVFGLVARSVVARTQGRLSEAVSFAQRAVDLADRSGGPARHRHPKAWLAGSLAALDRFDEALDAYASGEREAISLGIGWSLPVWHFMRASLLSWRGELDDAIAEAEAGLQVGDQLTQSQLTLPIVGLLTRIALIRGEPAKADQHFTRMQRLTASGITAAPEDVAWTFAVYHDARDERQAALQAMAGYYDAMPGRLLLLSHDPGAGAVLVRLAQAVGDRPRAQQAARAARALADLNPGAASIAAGAAHACGLLRGDLAELRRAVELYQASPRPLARARALQDAAAAERRAGHRARAERLTEQAQQDLRAAGVHSDVAGAASRTKTSTLSNAELAVATRVAEGKTNRQVADELFLSVHTVDSHLRHIFAKVGINRRGDLIRYMLREHGAI